MNKEKRKIYKFVFTYLIFMIILTIFAFVYAILINNDVIMLSNKSFKNISFILGLLVFLILGIVSGITAKKNGLVEGLFSSLIIISISMLLNLILKIEIEPLYFIKIISYLICSMAGGIIGVNIIHKNN